jgi:16S rRNA (guanine1207-N2)-methyltransferase
MNELTFSSVRGGLNESFGFLTCDGLVSKNEIRDEELAILDSSNVESDDDILVIDGNYGVAGVVLSHRASDGETVVTETSARAANICRMNANRNGAENLSVELTPEVRAVAKGFDVAVFVPKPYQPVDVVNQKLADAVSRLGPDGRIYIAGKRQDGVERYAETLSSYTRNKSSFSHGDVRVYEGTRSESIEEKSYLQEHEFRATIDDITCRFLTVPGLFSWRNLDDGTEGLLRSVSISDDHRVLDCCCGYGAIGAFVGAQTDCELWATDDDVVATTYANKNFYRNGVKPHKVLTDDALDSVPDSHFHRILMNPPTHVGKRVTAKLFSSAHDALVERGILFLVANEIMNYDVRLAEEFGYETSIVNSLGKFDVIRAETT